MKNNAEWYQTHTVAPGVTAINENDMVTMYLIEGTWRALLLDTGWGIGNLASLLPSLTDRPVTVMHTHGHIDHVSGAWQFGEVFLPCDDEPLFLQSYQEDERRFHAKVMLSQFLGGDEAERWIRARPARIRSVAMDTVFDLGGRVIRMMPFPGHTRGSAVFLDEDSGLLFTGDSIGEGALWMHTVDAVPLDRYLASLQSLAEMRLKIKTLLPAHGRTPIDPAVIDEYRSGVQDILSGKLTGAPTTNHAGDGLLCQFQENAIIYDPKKLRE